MSWYLADEDGIVDQFASGQGLADLREASAKYPALKQFLDEGATKNVVLCIAQLSRLAKASSDDTVVSTARGLAKLMNGKSLVSITQGNETEAVVSESLREAKKKGKRTLMVAAFSAFNKRGKPINPVAINVGDQIYLQRQSEAGAGLLRAAGPEDSATARGNGRFSQTQAGIGRLYATALEALAAGEIAEIAAQTYEKRWVTDGEPCPICDENAIAGWIDADEEFPSGDDEPLAHNNCKCEMELRKSSDA